MTDFLFFAEHNKMTKNAFYVIPLTLWQTRALKISVLWPQLPGTCLSSVWVLGGSSGLAGSLIDGS